MKPHQYFTDSRILRVFRLGILFLLVITAPAALAELDCHHYIQEGWSVGSVCISQFDDNGDYQASLCKPDQYENPDHESHGICKAGMDAGTCQGMTCTQEPACTWQGSCATDLDCCGMNVCDLSFHRCGEPQGGGGWGMFQE